MDTEPQPSFLRTVVRRHPGRIIVAFLLVSIGAGLAAARVRVDTNISKLFVADDPVRLGTANSKADFGEDELIAIAFDLDHPFTADDLRKLRTISEQISRFEGVDEVLGLSTTEDLRAGEEGLDASALVNFDTVDKDLEAIRQRVRDHRLYTGNLVSNDLRVLALVVYLESGVDRSTVQHTVDRILELVTQQAPPWRPYLSGYPVAEHEGNRIATRDFSLLTVVALILIFFVVYIATRKASALLLLGSLILWTELATLGWLGLRGTPLGVVTSIVPTVAATISSTYAIYVLGLLPRIADQEHPGAALADALARPVLLSGTSTGIGFLSLGLISSETIGELGMALAVTSVAAVVGALLLLPALIDKLHLRSTDGHAQWIDRLGLSGIGLTKRPIIPLAATALAIVVSLVGVSKIVVDTDAFGYYAKDNLITVGNDFFERRLAPPFVVNVAIRTDHEDGALNPSVMSFTDSLVSMIKEDSYGQRVISFLDYVFLIDAALRPTEPPRTVLPTRELASQYLLLYDSGAERPGYERYLNHDRSAQNIVVRYLGSSQTTAAFARRVEAFAKSAPSGVSVSVLGTSYLFDRAMIRLGWDMVRSLITALFFIVLVMTIFLKSLKLALIAAIPNAVPILCCSGLLGWFGLELSMGASVVGCIALGLAVDDTAHVLGHVRHDRPLSETYRIVGRPVVLTTIALGLGFSALLLSDFKPAVMIGAGTAITLVLALLCNLLLFPTLLVCLGYKAEGSPIDLRAIEQALSEPRFQHSDTAAIREVASQHAAGSITGVEACIRSMRAVGTRVPTSGPAVWMTTARSHRDFAQMFPWLPSDLEVWSQALSVVKDFPISPINYQGENIGWIHCIAWTNEMLLSQESPEQEVRDVVNEYLASKTPQVVGLGGVLPTLLDLGRALEDKTEAKLVTGHHSTAYAVLEMLRCMDDPRENLAIVGVGQMGRAVALAVAKLLAGVRTIVLIDPWAPGLDKLAEEIEAMGVSCSVAKSYAPLEQADVVLAFTAAIDYPGDRYVNRGGRLKENAVIINDAQPPWLSWETAGHLWERGHKVYAVLLGTESISFDYEFEPRVGGVSGRFAYTCLVETVAALETLRSHAELPSLVGPVSTSKFDYVKTSLGRVGAVHGLYGWGV